MHAGTSTPTAIGRASGWHTIEINGHDIEEIDRAFAEAVATTGRPTMIVARTIKGYGASETANVEASTAAAQGPEKAIHELGDVPPITWTWPSRRHRCAAQVPIRSLGASPRLRTGRRSGTTRWRSGKAGGRRAPAW